MINKKKILSFTAVILSVTLFQLTYAESDTNTCDNQTTTYKRFTCLNTQKSSSLAGSISLDKLQTIIEKLDAVIVAVNASSSSSAPAPAPAPAAAPATIFTVAKKAAADTGSFLGKVASAINPFNWW